MRAIDPSILGPPAPGLGEFDTEPDRLLWLACARGDADAAREAIVDGADPARAVSSGGQDPLARAVAARSLPCAELLLPLCDPLERDAMGLTPLMSACRRGYGDLARALAPAGGLGLRGPVPGQPGLLWTALMFASDAAGPQAGWALLDLPGARLASRDGLGRSAAGLARARGHGRLALAIQSRLLAQRQKGALESMGMPGLGSDPPRL